MWGEPTQFHVCAACVDEDRSGEAPGMIDAALLRVRGLDSYSIGR